MALNQVATDRERKKSEQRLDHLNRVLKAIRKVNRLMVAETDPGPADRGRLCRIDRDPGLLQCLDRPHGP